MSLTSYRAAPPRAMASLIDLLDYNTKGRFVSGPLIGFGPLVLCEKILFQEVAFCRPGSDLLSRVLRRSTMGAGAFHGRVRKGNGCSHPAITTRSAKRNFMFEKLVHE